MAEIDRITKDRLSRDIDLVIPGSLVSLAPGNDGHHPTSPFIPFTAALSGNTASANTRSATPR
jgi:hypothetical protein